jgi:hypothetical protein
LSCFQLGLVIVHRFRFLIVGVLPSLFDRFDIIAAAEPYLEPKECPSSIISASIPERRQETHISPID